MSLDSMKTLAIRFIDLYKAFLQFRGGGIDNNVYYEKVISDIKKKYDIPMFYARNFSLDLTKNVFDFLFEFESDYLVLDMSCCRYDILKNDDNEFLSDVNAYHHREIAKMFCENYHKSFFSKRICNDEEILDLLKQYIPRYLDIILEKVPVSRIILIETRAANFYLNENGQISEFPRNIVESFDKRMQYGFHIASDYLKGCHIIRFPTNVLGDAKHKWGKASLHYTKDFYEYAYQAVNIIAQNKSFEEENTALCVLYDNTCTKLQKKFDDALLKTLRGKADTENVNARLWKYNHYFQDLLLNSEKLQNAIRYLQTNKIHSCAFYGLTQIAIFFIKYLKKYQININYIVESGGEKSRDGIPRFERSLTDYPQADLIIISDVTCIEAIREKLKQLTTISLIDVYQLLEKNSEEC